MGLALLSKTASPSDTILYTICVNGMAYKFLTTVLMIDEPDELSRKLWKGALVYKKTAQRALKKIGLLTAPSLTLLQAILCGVSESLLNQLPLTILTSSRYFCARGPATPSFVAS